LFVVPVLYRWMPARTARTDARTDARREEVQP
jgi:hypothetical protein